MSKNINVNPDHYKGAGRERQGEDIAQDLQRRTFAEKRSEIARWQKKQKTGAAPRRKKA